MERIHTPAFQFVLAAVFCGAVSVAAAEEPADMVSVEVMSGWRTSGGSHMSAIRMTLAPGWKTYWRTPGDAGIQPRVRWMQNVDISGASIHWPVPGVFLQNGYRSVGYEGQVVVPMEIVTREGAGVVALDGQLDIGICADVCVPISIPLSMVLPDTERQPDPAIAAALLDRPMTAAEAGAGRVRCVIEPIADGLRLTAQMRLPPFGASEHAVVEFKDKTIWVSEADVARDGGQLSAVVDMVPPNAQPFVLSREDLTFTVLADGRSVEMSGCEAG